MTSKRTRRVEFFNWDSDDERERSQKGVVFRQKRKQRKIARRQKDIRSAQDVWSVFIDPLNEGPISDFARNNHVFFVTFQSLFRAFRRSPLWGRLRNPQAEGPYSASAMIHILRRSGVSFTELQQADNEEFQFLDWLRTIGGIPGFVDRFLSRPIVSASSSEDSQDSRARRGQRAEALRRRPRDDNEERDARPRHRRRQE
jgi:hypothetical protein